MLVMSSKGVVQRLGGDSREKKVVEIKSLISAKETKEYYKIKEYNSSKVQTIK